VLFQRLEREGSDDDGAPAPLRFRLRLRVALARQLARDAREHPAHLHGPLRKINVLPLQAEEFAAPHPGRQRQFEERRQAVALCRREQPLDLLQR
jgi:hypothetical protein